MRLKLLTTFLMILFLGLPVQAQDNQPSMVDDMEGMRVTLAAHKHNIDWDNTEQNVFVEIYADTSQIKPGKPFPLIIEQIIRPEWHVYWKNPGDSGEALHGTWDLPKNFSMSEIEWPTPKNLPFEILVNYGYEGEVMLYQELLVPDELPSGAISIPVRFDILVCKEICIPESINKKIILNSDVTSADLKVVSKSFLREARSLMPIKKDVNTWEAKMYEQDGMLVLDMLTDNNEAGLKQHTFSFFPYEYGLIEASAKPEVTIEDNRIIFKQKRGKFELERIEDTSGVFSLNHTDSGMRFGYEIDPKIIDAPESTAANTATSNGEGTIQFASAENLPTNIFAALLFAVIGGLILNLMPCVFPVLSMKALSVSRISEHSKAEAQKHGIAYTLGIIVSMLAIAGLLIALKAGGSTIGWGFHLQDPVVILLLSYLFFVIGLNLSGYFEFGTKLMSIGQGQKTEGVTGSFMTGILATTVATPCTAPFMATALAYALNQPPIISLIIFAALGFGLALPFLLISFIPSLQKAMPRPGPWMVTFKEFLAFPMFATVIWLLWIFTQQTGMNGIIMPLIGLLGITMTIWFFNRAEKSDGLKKFILMILAIATIASSMVYSLYQIQMVEMVKDKPMAEFGANFTPDALDNALMTDQPVFVEMTAAWCVTCKVNHYRAIDIPQTRNIIEKQNISYLIGDWTNRDGEITKYLNKFGRNGVPIYVYYGRPDPKTGKRPVPEVLPQLLSPSIIADKLDR